MCFLPAVESTPCAPIAGSMEPSLSYSADLDIWRVAKACSNYIKNTFKHPAEPTAWQVDLSVFITEVITLSGFDPTIAVVALLLLHRHHTLNPDIALYETDAHKLYLSAYIISTKLLYDGRKRLDWWVMVSGFTFEVKDLVKMEMDFIIALDWRLHFDIETYETFSRLMRRHAGKDLCRYEHRPTSGSIFEQCSMVSGAAEELEVVEAVEEVAEVVEVDKVESDDDSMKILEVQRSVSPPAASPPPSPLVDGRPPVRCTPPRRNPDSVDTIPSVHSPKQTSYPMPPPSLVPGPGRPVPVSRTITLPRRMTQDLTMDSDCTMWTSRQKGVLARLISAHYWSRLVIRIRGGSTRHPVAVGLPARMGRRRVSGEAAVPSRRKKRTLRDRFFGVFL